MKRFLQAIFVMVLGSNSYSQEAMTVFSVNSLPQIYRFNPAEYDDYPSVINFPPVVGVYLNYKNPLSFNQIFTEARNSYVFNQSTFITGLKRADSKKLAVDATADLFYYSFKLPRNTTVRFFGNLKFFANGYYPVNFLEAAIDGWGGSNIGRRFTDDITFKGMGYVEIGAGITSGFGRALQLGGAIKYYHGLYYADTNSTNVSIYSNPSDYSLDISLRDYEIYFKSFGPGGGNGVGVDLGITYDLGLVSRLPIKIGLSVLDIGVIQWQNVSQNSADTTALLIDNLSDLNVREISELFNGHRFSKGSLVAMTPAKVFGSISYYPSRRDMFTLTSFNTFYTFQNRESSISLGYSRKIWRDKISLTVSGVKLPDRPLGMGAGLTARFGGLQIYALSDDLFNTISGLGDVSNRATALNLRIGMNVLLGMPRVTNFSLFGGGKRYGSRGYQNRPRGNYSSRSGGGRVNSGGGARGGVQRNDVDTHDYTCPNCRPPRN